MVSDPHLEVTVQIAVRQAIASMGIPTPHAPSILSFGTAEESVQSLDEMEAAHKGVGLRLAKARKE